MITAIFDIDGCIADSSRRVAAYITTAKATGTKINWPAFFDNMENDPPIQPVLDIAEALDNAGYEIVFCTGRPAQYMHQTMKWLNAHIPWREDDQYRLLMRPENVFINDDILKQGMLATLRNAGLTVELAFDDRQRILRMYQREGVVAIGTNASAF